MPRNPQETWLDMGDAVPGAIRRGTAFWQAGPAKGSLRLTTRKTNTKRNRARMFKLMGNACVCCGERDPLFFQIDHIHNDADYSGLNSNNARSIQLHQYLAEPERYQLLCANCNYAKRMNNGELYRPTSFTRRKSAPVE